MTVLVVTRGLQASGKTTRAREWVREDPVTRARVNRDDLRAMLHESVYLGHETERAVVAARDAQILALLRRGVSVVNDDTNLKQRAFRDVAKLAALAGAELDVWDMTDTPLNVCIDRDQLRGGHLWEEVIPDYHARYLRGKSYPLPTGLTDDVEQDELQPYVAPQGADPVIIVDIDGTVALKGNRLPFDETRVHEDRPNTDVIEAVRAMRTVGYDVIFVSGRTAGCRTATKEWLYMHVGIPYLALHMREVGDTRNDTIVKREIFDREIRDRYTVMGAFDDRQRVVDMWRSLGLTVFQVAPGDF